MGSDMWAAIVGSLVLAAVTGVGILFWSHMTSAQEDAEAAKVKAHSLEVLVLEQRAHHSEELRAAEKQFHAHQMEVANNYVRKSDHDNVVTEIFRKLDNQDRQQAQGFTSLRAWLDGKFDKIAEDLHAKQDRRGG